MTCSCKSPRLSQTDPELPHGWEPTESPVDQLSFPTSVAGQTGEIHRMDPVVCRPTVKCRKTGSARSCTPCDVEHGYQAGKETATCKICGTTFPRDSVTLSEFNSCKNASPAISPRSSWVSRGELPRETSAPSGEDTVMEDYSPRTTNCGKFSRTCQRNTECSPMVAVSGPTCSRWMMRKQPYWQLLRANVRSAGSCGAKLLPRGAAALSDMSCVDGTRAHSVVCESLAVSPGFDGAAMLTNSSKLSGGSCGKDTHPAEHMSPHAACDTSASCTLRRVSA